MKIWTRLGFAMLALAMFAALALVVPSAPARATHVDVCEDPGEYCEEIAGGNPDDFFFCAVFAPSQAGCPAAACPYLNGFIFYFICDADIECYETETQDPEYLAAKAALCQSGGGCGDARVNQNCSAPEIVYCEGDSAKFYAYNYATLEGDFDFEISLADLQQSVEEKTLIKQDGTVKVYLMPDDRVLLVARQPDGKDYFMYWNPNTCMALQEGAEWNVQ